MSGKHLDAHVSGNRRAMYAVLIAATVLLLLVGVVAGLVLNRLGWI